MPTSGPDRVGSAGATESVPASKTPAGGRVLKVRIATALVLAPVLLVGVVWLPPDGFALFVLLLAVPGLYEWAALAGFEGVVARAGYAIGGAACLGVLWALPDSWPLVLSAACAFWFLAALFVFSYPAGRSVAARRIWMALAGAPVFAGAWLGLVMLKGSALSHWLIVWMFVLVWAADSGAYFAGRAFGRRRLAPSVSPGKTWEGAIAGSLLAVLGGTVFAWAFSWQPLLDWLLAAAALAAVAVVGDLFESAVKRARAVKDSGGLLPGHGGVLDRIDSTLAVAPVFALCLPLLV